jgi:hypothetical protein
MVSMRLINSLFSAGESGSGHCVVGSLGIGPDLGSEKPDEQAEDHGQGGQHHGRYGLERSRPRAGREGQHGSVDHPGDE